MLPVWIHDCTNSVCNGYYSALLKWCSQCTLNVSIRFCIYICCCLINAQDLWQSKKILSNLTPWSRDHLEKLIIKTLPPFITPGGSLPCPQNSKPHPESGEIAHIHTAYFFNIHFNIILPFKLPIWLFPSGFLTKILYAFLISWTKHQSCYNFISVSVKIKYPTD
jgi:hypothetical protein